MSNKINILAVDDQPENLIALVGVLEDLNIDIITANSGIEALEHLLEKEVALILMDVMMPFMDGYETAELIRQRKKTCHIPIIFISALNLDQEHLFRGYSSGAVDYLSKPVLPQVLKSKVSIFVELYQQGRKLRNKARALQEANEQILLQQKALANSELRFRTAFEQSFQFMAILDPQGRVIELNKLAQNLCGDYSGMIVGQHIWNVCWVGQEEENARLESVVRRAASGECVTDEASFRDINGKERFLYRAISPVKDEKGRVIYITVQGHDITQRVLAEKEKRNLETLLQQAQKMEALGTLAGGIAHDFNNVLSVIIGNVDLAENLCSSESQLKHFLRRISAAGHKAKDLVRQILSFSRQSEVQRVVFSPSEAVLESIKLLRSSIPTTIDIEHQIDATCGPILADPTQYHQIIMNLCTNAFHAMEENGGVLYLALQQQHLDEDFLPHAIKNGGEAFACLTVKDNGHGIDEGDLEKIFDPYFTTKAKDKGTGMGLSIVHGIVKSHGGILLVDSSPETGTSFQVFFPLANTTDIKKEAVLELPSCGNEKILLVDDEEQLLEMVKSMLELIGYSVDVDSRSRNALAHFCDDPYKYDLVITDQTMPGLTGTELARRMLRIRPDLPIVLCTGYSPNVSQETVTAMGIRKLAYKPLALDELSKIVRSAIDSPF